MASNYITLTVNPIKTLLNGRIRILRGPTRETAGCIHFNEFGQLESCIGAFIAFEKNQCNWDLANGQVNLKLSKGEFEETDIFELSCVIPNFERVHRLIRGNGLIETITQGNDAVEKRGIQSGNKIQIHGRYIRPATTNERCEFSLVELSNGQLISVLNSDIIKNQP